MLADEVYQQNVYQDERPFVSAKKVKEILDWILIDLSIYLYFLCARER